MIEILFQASSPQTSHVHGEGRNYVTTLIGLDVDAVRDCAAAASAPKDTGSLSGNPRLRELIQGQIDTLNGKLECWETIKNLRILDH